MSFFWKKKSIFIFWLSREIVCINGVPCLLWYMHILYAIYNSVIMLISNDTHLFVKKHSQPVFRRWKSRGGNEAVDKDDQWVSGYSSMGEINSGVLFRSREIVDNNTVCLIYVVLVALNCILSFPEIFQWSDLSLWVSMCFLVSGPSCFCMLRIHWRAG